MKRRVLISTALVILGFIEIGLFLTATSYIQLGAATLLYPVLAFFIFKLFPSKTKLLPVETSVTVTPVNTPINENEKVSDMNKRAFLNTVFTAGIAFFIYSILNKSAEISFLGKAAGPGTVVLQDATGNKINPAQEQLTGGYEISDLDEEGQDFIYYGYTKLNGSWYITKQNVETGAFRYVKGQSNYPANWKNRIHLNYDYFYNVFS